MSKTVMKIYQFFVPFSILTYVAFSALIVPSFIIVTLAFLP